MRYPQPYVDFAPGITALRDHDDDENIDHNDENDTRNQGSHRSLTQSMTDRSIPIQISSTSNGDTFAEVMSLASSSSRATSIASSQASSHLSSSQRQRKLHPWEQLDNVPTLLGDRRKQASTRRPWGGGPVRQAIDPDESRSATSNVVAQVVPNGTLSKSSHVRSSSNSIAERNELLELSTHSTQSRTRYVSVSSRTQGREANSTSGYSFFNRSLSAGIQNHSNRNSMNEEAAVPITASAVFSSLMGYVAQEYTSETNSSQKAPTLRALFRLDEEELPEDFNMLKIRQGIELSRQNQKVKQNSNYEVDAPQARKVVLQPEVQGQGLESTTWEIPNNGQELDQFSDSETVSSTGSLDNGDDPLYPGLMSKYSEYDDHDASHELLEKSEFNLHSEESAFDQSKEIREAEEQLENLDHAGAVLNSFNSMLQASKTKSRRNEYNALEKLPPLVPFGDADDGVLEDLDPTANLALKAFIFSMMLTVENHVHPSKASLTDLFKWSQKENIDKTVRSKFRNNDDLKEMRNASKRVSRADVLFGLGSSSKRMIDSDSQRADGIFPPLPSIVATSLSNQEMHVQAIETSAIDDNVGTKDASNSVVSVEHPLALKESTPRRQNAIEAHSEHAGAVDTNSENPFGDENVQQTVVRTASLNDMIVGDLESDFSKPSSLSARGAFATNDTMDGSVASANVPSISKAVGTFKAGRITDRGAYTSGHLKIENSDRILSTKTGTQVELDNVTTDLKRNESKFTDTSSGKGGGKNISAVSKRAKSNVPNDIKADYNDSNETGFSQVGVNLNVPNPIPKGTVPDDSEGGISSSKTVASVSGHSTGELKDVSTEVKMIRTSVARLDPAKIAKVLNIEKARTQEDSNGYKGSNDQQNPSKGSRKHSKKQRAYDNGKRGVSETSEISSAVNIGTSGHAVEPEGQTERPHLKKLASYRREDLDDSGATPLKIQKSKRRLKSESEKTATVPLRTAMSGSAALDEQGISAREVKASRMMDRMESSKSCPGADLDDGGTEPDSASRTLAISPEEVIAALTKGGTTRKNKRTIPRPSALQQQSSRTLPQIAVKGSIEDQAVIRAPSTSASARGLSNPDKVIGSPKFSSRSSKDFTTNRTARKSQSVSSDDDDSIMMAVPTFRKAPRRRSVSQANIVGNAQNISPTASATGGDRKPPARKTSSSSNTSNRPDEHVRKMHSQSQRQFQGESSRGPKSNRDINDDKKSSRNIDVDNGESAPRRSRIPTDREQKIARDKTRSTGRSISTKSEFRRI